jgi:hypothetical protein
LLKQGQELMAMSRLVVLRTWVLNHSIHHRAHLCVYLRVNDIPVPGLYGPSADDTGASASGSQICATSKDAPGRLGEGSKRSDPRNYATTPFCPDFAAAGGEIGAEGSFPVTIP